MKPRKLDYAQMQPLGRKLLDKHGLQDWHISVENLRNSAVYGPDAGLFLGWCDFENKTIRVDWEARGQFRQTVLHEIAHALAPTDKGHGEEWLKKAEEVGCTAAHLWPYYLALGERKRGGVS